MCSFVITQVIIEKCDPGQTLAELHLLQFSILGVINSQLN